VANVAAIRMCRSKWAKVAVVALALSVPDLVNPAEPVDTNSEIAAALYAASATQAAADKLSDEKLKTQRRIIAQLQQRWHDATIDRVKARSELAAAQENFATDRPPATVPIVRKLPSSARPSGILPRLRRVRPPWRNITPVTRWARW
jgi:hypothetical protein